MEQAVAHADLGAGERVQQRRLAGVRVADERDRRQRRALALGALHRARALDVLQAPAQRRDAVARQAAVGLDLRLAGAPRADPAAEPLEVAPQPAHAREVVLELGELDLELALGAARVRGEDVEDHGRAIDDRQAERLLEVALLARGQLVVAGDQVRVAGLRGGLRLGDLAGPEVGVRVRLLAALDHLADDRHAGGAQQLAQLGEVVALGQRRDAERALARAVPLRAVARRLGVPGGYGVPRRPLRLSDQFIRHAARLGGASRGVQASPSRCNRLQQALVGRGQRDAKPALARGPVDRARARARRPPARARARSRPPSSRSPRGPAPTRRSCRAAGARRRRSRAARRTRDRAGARYSSFIEATSASASGESAATPASCTASNRPESMFVFSRQ